jgi:hypothetical protein
MPKEKPQKKKAPAKAEFRKKRTVATITLVLICGVGASMLAQMKSLKGGKTKPGEVSIASLAPGSPSKEYVYAGGRLVATEEPIASGGLLPPTNLFATVSSFSAAQINLSWTASPSQVHHYQVERSANFSATGNGFSFVVDVAGTSYSDIPPGSGVRAYMYRVRAADATNTIFSAYSNYDLGTTIIFTDASLPGQIIKGIHLTEVRQTVNAVRALANPAVYPAINWIDPAPQGVRIKAQHMLDLRSSVNPALSFLGLLMVSSDSSLAVGNAIKGVHLQDVRDKLK